MKMLWRLLFLLVAVVLLLVVWHWDRHEPVVVWDPPRAIGKESRLKLQVQDVGKGLKSVTVAMRQGEVSRTLVDERFTRGWLPWDQAPLETDLDIPLAAEIGDFKEGPIEVEVTATDQGNLRFFSRQVRENASLTLDLTPPRIEVLSGQHYLYQGGSEAVLYRVSPDTVRSGARVGDRIFLGYPVPAQGPGVHLSLLALGYDEPTDTRLAVWAEDEAGNRSEAGFWHRIFARNFRQRQIQITDEFINKVAPEILSHSPSISKQPSLKETYLEINARLRELNNRQIEEMTRDSSDRALWEAPFLQLTGSQVESAFADRRSYIYKGEKIDEQTHLGFDLASLANSPVEASNSGVVIFADYLGIYGNCVLIDHGLGLFSLYGHLNSIGVEVGQPVERGQTIGRTGQTGLAAGDHLHFTMVVQGVQVTPLEWWDPKWVQEKVFSKLHSKGSGSSP
jgi:murein DD-endopeptidase MepM/ murein hydrolase activator NlpD